MNPINLGLDLPSEYKSRTFVKGLSGYSKEIDKLVGSLILIDGKKTSFVKRLIKDDKPPIATVTTTDVIYNAKIDTKFKMNGDYAIASVKVESNSVHELIVTDIGYALLPAESIPYLELCKASVNVDANTKQNLYYIQSAKLSTVYTKAFTKTDAASNVNGTVFSVGGEVYSSSDQFSVNYVVSVDMIRLDKLLSIENCDELINNEELIAREKAEKAKLDAHKAGEEKKARELELNSAKAEVERLQGEVNKTTEIQNQLIDAIEKEKQARYELERVQKEVDTLKKEATKDEISAEKQSKLILTLKNKEGKTLDIHNLEELTPEKLKELGFDVEILQNNN